MRSQRDARDRHRRDRRDRPRAGRDPPAAAADGDMRRGTLAARPRARGRGLRGQFGGGDHPDKAPTSVRAAGLHACRRRRVREPRGELDRGESRRADVQRTRAPLRHADGLHGRRPPEPAELPRARVGLDARDLERLHRLRRPRAAASPTRSRPPARPGRRTPRIFRIPASPAARPAATRRSTTRSSTSATSPARGRAVTASSRSPQLGRDLARAPAAGLLPRDPEPLRRHARLLGRDRRRLAEGPHRPAAALAASCAAA